jgi:hypothetical protein
MEKKRTALSLIFENQVVVEKQIVDSIEKSIVDMKNPAVKGVLKGVSLDSVKHAELYSSAITLLTQASTALNQGDLDFQKKLIQKHIDIESELI